MCIKILLYIILLGIITCCILMYKEQENFTNDKIGYSSDVDDYILPKIVPNLLTIDQCNKIINHSQCKLIQSEILGGVHKNIRNSKQHWISKTDPLVSGLFERISKMYNIPLENAEDLQVVNYQPNQYYNEHHDACCNRDETCKKFVERGGQRKLTVLIYLNADFTDGETYFKNLDLKIKAPTGDAIVFHPLAEKSSKCHPKALHAGLPITSGEKWVANVWFREFEYI